MANRLKPPTLPPVGLLRIRVNWRATLILIAILAVTLLPVWGSLVARIQSSTFPYPGLEMDYTALAVNNLDKLPTYQNLTLTANFLDLYSYGGSLLLKVDITVHDSATTVVEKYVDVNTRQEYVTVASGGTNIVVSAAVDTVLWLPKNTQLGQMVGVNSFMGTLEGPVSTDAFGNALPFGMAYLVRTAEGSFYYSMDTRVLELYQSNVATSSLGFATPTPLRSITLVTYNDVAARGTLQGLIASLFVLLAVVLVFGLHHNIDQRRRRRLEGLNNRIQSLSDILEDQYLLGLISRETYMRRQVVLRRLASDIEVESQKKLNHNNNDEMVAGDADLFPAP